MPSGEITEGRGPFLETRTRRFTARGARERCLLRPNWSPLRGAIVFERRSRKEPAAFSRQRPVKKKPAKTTLDPKTASQPHINRSPSTRSPAEDSPKPTWGPELAARPQHRLHGAAVHLQSVLANFFPSLARSKLVQPAMVQGSNDFLATLGVSSVIFRLSPSAAFCPASSAAAALAPASEVCARLTRLYTRVPIRSVCQVVGKVGNAGFPLLIFATQ